MKVAHEKIASMTDTFMDPSVPLIGTNAVALTLVLLDLFVSHHEEWLQVEN